MVKNYFLVFIAFLCFSLSGYGQGTETFSNIPTINAYNTGTWTGDDGSTWTATKSTSSQTINDEAITLNDDVPDSYIESGSISGGIGNITISTQRKYTGGSGNMNVSINGTNVGTIPYSDIVQTTTIIGINVSGNIIIRIDNNIGGSNSGGADRVAVDDITWTAYAASPCSGTPTPGNTESSETSVESGNTTNLSLQTPTAGSGITYQWQSSTTSAIAGFSNVVGETGSTYTATVNEKTWYRCVVTCSANSGTSTAVLVDVYACTSIPSSKDNDGISSVTVGSATFSVSDVTQYTYTGSVPDLTQGANILSSITFETDYTYDTHIWIDFNDDNVFDNITEKVFTGESADAAVTTLTTNFTLVASAAIGQHKMRIGTADSGQGTPDPCYSGSYGVTIDLDVNIIASCTPATDPVGSITGTSPACTSTVLTYTGADSATAYWQTTATGTDMSEPATATKTITTSGTYYIRINDGTCWSTGTVNQTVVINPTTAITTQPVSQSVSVGTTPTFSVVATGGGLTYQWQQKIGAGAWTNVGTDSTSFTTPTTTLAMDGYQYRVLVTGACGSVTSNEVTLNVSINYCSSTGASNNSGIVNVSFNTINQTSNSNVGYTDYTSVSTNVTIGDTYNLSINVNTNGNYTSYVKVWFDWNYNGTFSASEAYELGSITNNSNGQPSASPYAITIPSGATVGSVRMRVAANSDNGVSGYSEPCETFTYGEVEDYIITIIPSCTPATDPVGSITGTSPACTSTVLTYSGADSANAYWQTTVDGISTSEPANVSKTVATSGTYYVRTYNSATSCWSTGNENTTVVINTIPNIVTQPANETVIIPATANFTVAATGGGLTYQWQVSTDCGSTWSNVSTGTGGTTNSYTTTATTTAMDGYLYNVIITNSCGVSTSTNASININNTFTDTYTEFANEAPYNWAAENYATPSWSQTIQGKVWQGGSVNINTGNSRIQFANASSNLITPAIANPTEVIIYAQNSSSSVSTSHTLKLQYSTDGISFTDVSTVTIGGNNSSYNYYSYDVSAYTSLSSVYFKFVEPTGSNNIYIKNIEIKSNIPPSSATDYTWTGNADSTSWIDACNWSPRGIPTSIDNVIFNTSPTYLLNIIDSRTVNNFTLNGTGNFNMASTGVLTINGNITYENTATATLDCDSQMLIKSPNSQPIPPLTYGSLDVLGGDRVFSPTGTIKICGGFNVVPDPSTSIYTVIGSTVEYTSPDSGWVMTPFTYNNLTFSGTGDFSLGYSSPAVNKTVNVLGDFVQTNGTVFLGETSSRTATLNIDGNMTVSGGTFDVNNTSGGTGIVNLKGDLSVASSAQLFATSASTATFNFNAIGDGLSAAATQTIDIASTNTSNIDFNVKTNAYTQLINQNFRPAARTKLNVETGATLDFGFNGTTALNFAGNGITGTGFTSAAGSYLKISSPQGIMNTSGAVGNIQTNTAPVINALATFHYIGKTNQVTGNGFGTSSNGRAVIVELADNNYQLGLSQSFGITGLTNTNINNGLGGILNIKKGKVIEDATNYITGSSGSLIMEDGTLYAIAKNSDSGTDYIPRLNTYNLVGTSTIQLNGSGNQILRGGRDYRNLTFSNSGIKDISSSILSITGVILIEDDAVLNIEYEETMGGSGTNLTMTDNSEYITASTSSSGGVEPAAQGTYTLIDNSKITFAHNIANGTTLQTPKLPKIYNNIDIVGDHVGIASPSAAAPIKFNDTYSPTFTIKPTGVFKFNNTAGFNGSDVTAIDNTNSPTITLETGSTVEYAGTNQTLTELLPNYSNLNISGTGTKQMGANAGIIIGENLDVISSKLYINNSKFVQVQDNVVISDSLLVETKGAFVQVDDAGTFSLSGSGTATVNKVSSDKTTPMDYTYWSSPIETITIESVLTGTPASRKYKYVAANYKDEYMESGNNNDETTIGQDDIDDNGDDWAIATGVMSPGSGYAMTGPSFLPPGPPTYVDKINFTGTFNTADIPTTIYENGFAADNDWNLIGNPYPSAIDFSLFHAENSAIIDGCAFVWSHSSAPDLGNNGNEVYNFSQDDYSIITVGSGCVVAGPTIPILTDTSIPSGQGFFVIGKHITGSGSSANAVFKNAMRIADGTSNNEFYRNTEPTIEANKIWVNLTSDNGIFNQALIAYVDGATDNFDSYSYDAPRNLSSGTAAIIYTKIEDSSNKNFAIQGKHPNSLTLDEVIPLGFYTAIDVATLYKFSIAQLEGDFMNTNAIYILDKLNNTTHNLKDLDYTFTSEKGEFNDRFEIVFTQSTLSIDDHIVEANEVTITEFQNGDVQIKVGNTHTIKHVAIIDVTGRIIYNLQGHDSTEVYDLSKLSQAAYIAKITLSNGQVISKKAIKKH